MQGDLREDVIVILAWQFLLSQCAAQGKLSSELMRWRSLLSESFSPDPERALARALRPTIRRHGLHQAAFTQTLDAFIELTQVGSFETRSDLLQRARQLSENSSLALLSMLGTRNERNEILAVSLGSALQLIHWIENIQACMQREYLPLAVDDLTRHGLNILTLQAPGAKVGERALVADQIQWIRQLLAKGWPLCQELGWYRGRLLAFALRQQAARLGAIEAAGGQLISSPKRAGWFRILACLCGSIVTRSAPRFA
jgi:phytoene/squalene synthetase